MTTVAVHELLNTLYVMSQQAYVRLDHDTLKVEADGKSQAQVPLLHLGAIVCFGNVMVSPALIHRCAEDGRALVFLDHDGRFKARMVGATSGNVLLRQAQYRAAESLDRTLDIARNVVAGKIKNTRQVLLRAARQGKERDEDNAAPADGLQNNALVEAAESLGKTMVRLEKAQDIDTVRGCEGEAALTYFGVLDHMILVDKQTFRFDGRNRRPPRDPVNALLSFLYALVLNDCVAAAEGVGLDPQMGFLHAIRPGRPSLALDLVEELRAVVADRLALTLINRRQLTSDHFAERPGGSVLLTDEGRKAVVVAYQKRKSEEVRHQLLDRGLPVGLIPHVQARLLARHLRGDLEHYIPYINR
jgi:CRISPR-associated protein Cas1